MEQGSSAKVWWIVGVVMVAAIAFWYFYPKLASAPGQSAVLEETSGASTGSLSSGNTTADISADLSQIPDDTAALNADAAASAQDVSGF